MRAIGAGTGAHEAAPPSEADEDDDACYTVRPIGDEERAAEPSSPDDESEPSPAAPPAAPAPAPAAAEAAPPAWEQSARELLAAVRGRASSNPVGADGAQIQIGPRVHGSSYFCRTEAPGHYPCVYDIIGERYKDSKTSQRCSMGSPPANSSCTSDARGASVRLESAWDWAAHTGSRSRSRSPAQLERRRASREDRRDAAAEARATAVPATGGGAPRRTGAQRRARARASPATRAQAFWDHPDLACSRLAARTSIRVPAGIRERRGRLSDFVLSRRLAACM